MFAQLKQFGVALIIGVAMVWGTGPAQAGDVIKERHTLMEEIGQQLGKLVKVLKNEAPFNGQEIAAAAQMIKDNLDKAEKLFPKGSLSDKSRAKPEIWTDNATFMKAFDTAKKAAAKIVEIGKAEDEMEFPEAMNSVFQSCKGCHEKFRFPKKDN